MQAKGNFAMPYMKKIAVALLAASVFAAAACATVGGYYYAVQYDFDEFRAALDGKPFQVILAGNPFPQMPAEEVAGRLLPVMQFNKPRQVNLTFTYDAPTEEPHPYYRLVLIFNPASDFGGTRACNDKPRFGPGKPGQVYVFAVYCRNDLDLSETTAWTQANGPDDPRMSNMFKDLFRVIFDDSQARRPQMGRGRFH
jgi:hypothetical protein